MESTRGSGIGSAEALLVVASEPKKGYDRSGALDMLLPVAVLLDLADGAHVTMGQGRVSRISDARAEPGREYERAALRLGERLDGAVPDVLWAITDGLRPLSRAVATELVAEGRIDSTKKTLLRMNFGYRFPALDTDFRNAIRSRVQAVLESGDVTPPFGRTALLLAIGNVHARVFPGVDTTIMDNIAGDTLLAEAGFNDVTTFIDLAPIAW